MMFGCRCRGGVSSVNTVRIPGIKRSYDANNGNNDAQLRIYYYIYILHFVCILFFNY